MKHTKIYTFVDTPLHIHTNDSNWSSFIIILTYLYGWLTKYIGVGVGFWVCIHSQMVLYIKKNTFYTHSITEMKHIKKSAVCTLAHFYLSCSNWIICTPKYT